MTWVLALAGWLVGLEAVDKLGKPHPTPAAWFEAALTLVLIVGAIVTHIVRPDDVGFRFKARNQGDDE